MRVFSGRDGNKRLLGDLHCSLSLELVVVPSVVCFLWEISVGHKSLAWQTVPLWFRIHNGVWCDRLTSELLCWGSKATRGMIMRLKWIDKPGENKSYTITTYKLHCAYIWIMFCWLEKLIHVQHNVCRWHCATKMCKEDIHHNHEISQRYTCTRCKHLHDDLTSPFLNN